MDGCGGGERGKGERERETLVVVIGGVGDVFEALEWNTMLVCVCVCVCERERERERERDVRLMTPIPRHFLFHHLTAFVINGRTN